MKAAFQFSWIFILTIFLSASPNAFAMDISWNGFGSAYVGQSRNPDLFMSEFTSNKVDFTRFSLMGLNLSGQINEDFSFAGQLVALGSPVGTTDSFGLMAQWAFANYTPNDSLSVKAGRQLFPVFITSEYTRVGYLLPFRSVPLAFSFLAPFTRFDGVSLTQTFAVGNSRASVRAYAGVPQLDVNASALVTAASTTRVTQSDLLGLQASLDGEGWRLHASFARYFLLYSISTTTPASTTTLQAHPQMFSLGYRYDKNKIVSYGEWFFERSPGGTPINGGKFVGIGRGYYLLGGYRLGKFLPRYTFAHNSQQFNIITSSGNANGKLSSHTIGLNYQAGQQAVIKVEFERSDIPAPQRGGYMVTQSTNSAATKMSAYFAGVDFIF